MSESARERANRAQRAASDPMVSAFVAASAGSGKTKLLTDRLLRLMLTGAAPERIQCLTFTKAAAAEMALRLQRTLGRWVTMPEAELTAALCALDVEPTQRALRTARALFARVLDLPGGMRIGTIHAFSQSLLRRFPLEAAISPHFELVDERDAETALTEAREAMLASAATPGAVLALQAMAGLCSAHEFGGLVRDLQSDRERLARTLQLGTDLERAQRRVLGVSAESEEAVMEKAVTWMGEGALRDAARGVYVHPDATSPVRDRAAAILDWLSGSPEQRQVRWSDWLGLFLTQEMTLTSRAINKKVLTDKPALGTRYQEEATRIVAIEEERRGVRLAAISAALVTLAGPVAQAYAERKDYAGLLDYEDLIGRTSALLVDPGAAWVLYKLDGGLDHLLLDEVQDTAPQQWDIAHALTQEFFAGAGAREEPRTVFAVGDRKQSIYSFQGADTAEFDNSYQRLARRVRNSGQAFKDVGLDVSFRSTGPVLSLVDAVFADPIARSGVVADGETIRHFADRAGHAGVVELWPLAPKPDAVAHTPWTIPEENQSHASAAQVLADRLALWVRSLTDGSEMLESKGRPVSPGDVLVLVRRRHGFVRLLVRALKTRGVPVAGLDRMVLTEQAAVQDLMALGDALLLPSDDLSLACMLTSPLGGLSDDDLLALAPERDGSLWDALRRRSAENPAWDRAANFFAGLLSRVDYVSPYALFEEALGPLGGRARLFGRLGPEAAEPIDELLQAALTYAQRHPPSLQGFLQWLRQSGAEVKREAEAAGGLVRIMTVHGAKGLQAPVVVIPDTALLPEDDRGLSWGTDPATGIEVPLWAPRAAFRSAALRKLRAAARARQIEEHNRLLYVALTRAEDRLLVCGWQSGRGEAPDGCWHSLVRRGFEAMGAEQEPFSAWGGTLLRVRSKQLVAPDAQIVRTTAPIADQLPVWIGSAPLWRAADPPPEPLRPSPLAPSRPEGVDYGPVPAAASPLEPNTGTRRFQRGRLVHTLLQHLSEVTNRSEAAHRFLARLPPEEADQIAGEVLRVMEHPELAPLFGPDGRAEVPLTGMVGNAVVGGVVDRLVVLPSQVVVADFKTNRRTPAQVELTPVMYLRQMAAYRSVLQEIFPDRPVRCVLIWTRDVHVALLPDWLLDRHRPGQETVSEIEPSGNAAVAG
jgi:ATP-dependent helicase/nuclease subunit A